MPLFIMITTMVMIIIDFAYIRVPVNVFTYAPRARLINVKIATETV